MIGTVLVVLSPFYIFVLFKFASAGWLAGTRSYLRLYRKRNR